MIDLLKPVPPRSRQDHPAIAGSLPWDRNLPEKRNASLHALDEQTRARARIGTDGRSSREQRSSDDRTTDRFRPYIVLPTKRYCAASACLGSALTTETLPEVISSWIHW